MKKIYVAANDSGERTFIVANSFLNALDIWRDENRDPKVEDEIEQLWPTSLTLVTDTMILGID